MGKSFSISSILDIFGGTTVTIKTEGDSNKVTNIIVKRRNDDGSFTTLDGNKGDEDKRKILEFFKKQSEIIDDNINYFLSLKIREEEEVMERELTLSDLASYTITTEFLIKAEEGADPIKVKVNRTGDNTIGICVCDNEWSHLKQLGIRDEALRDMYIELIKKEAEIINGDNK